MAVTKEERHLKESIRTQGVYGLRESTDSESLRTQRVFGLRESSDSRVYGLKESKGSPDSERPGGAVRL